MNEIEQLKQENESLKLQNESYKKIINESTKFGSFITRIVLNFQLGKNLKNSINQGLEELKNDKKLTNSTIADLLAQVIWNFSRFGIKTLIIALIPLLFLIFQTCLLSKQNTKLDLQNDLIRVQNKIAEQQSQLAEAQRRSSLNFLFGNIIELVDKELKDDIGEKSIRDLSPQLIGSVSAISNGFKPYKYLDNDTLTITSLSPERGQLLLFLIGSRLDSNTYKEIYKITNFSFADLSLTSLIDCNLQGAYLKNTNFTGSNLFRANLINADLSNSNLTYATLVEAKTDNTNLFGSEMNKAYVSKNWINDLKQNILDKNDSPIKTIKTIGLNEIYGKYLVDTSYYEDFEVGNYRYKKYQLKKK